MSYYLKDLDDKTYNQYKKYIKKIVDDNDASIEMHLRESSTKQRDTEDESSS